MIVTHPWAELALSTIESHRKNNPLPSGWTETSGDAGEHPRLLLQNQDWFIEVQLFSTYEADADYVPGEFRAFVHREDRIPPSWLEAREIAQDLLGPSFGIGCDGYAAIYGWQNGRPEDYVWDGGPENHPNEHHAMAINVHLA